MLRRLVPSGTTASVLALARRQAFSTTSTRYDSKSGPDKEELEEIERERQLRQKFMNKMHGAQQKGGFTEMWKTLQQQAQEAQNQRQQGQTGGSGGGGAGQNANPFGAAQPRVYSFWDIMVLSTAIYAMIIYYQFNKEGSQLNRFQGIPWWAEPIDVVCAYLLSRVLLPLSQQRTLRMEYERSSRTQSGLTYAEFLRTSHPGIFDGYKTRHDEVIAAMCACFASSNDMRFAETMQRSVSGVSDTKAAVDAIMDSLKREFPHVFAPSFGGGGGYGGGMGGGGGYYPQQTYGPGETLGVQGQPFNPQQQYGNSGNDINRSYGDGEVLQPKVHNFIQGGTADRSASGGSMVSM